MTLDAKARTSPRLISLDAVRGITIAGMILVNNPGSWRHVYPPLRHAEWHGWTPTDLVFPFFLFVVGVSMAFSFRRRLEQGNRAELLAQIIRRSVIIFMLGLIMGGFPDLHLIAPYVLVIVGLTFLYRDRPILTWGSAGRVRLRKIAAWAILLGAVVYFALGFDRFQASDQRVPGVLQRIAVCYLCASLIVMYTGLRGRAVWTLLLLLGYWAIVAKVHAPAGYTANVTGPEGLLHDWIDVQLLGGHLYGERPDPEGILSTLPAIATVLLGNLTGQWLQGTRDRACTAVGLFFGANIALLLGLCWDGWFLINKKIWTSSYVLLTAGLATHLLAMCYWLMDVHAYRRWGWPFVVFGSNAITVYVASSLMAKLLYRTKLTLADGNEVAVKTWAYESLFASWADPTFASVLYAIAYVTAWLIPMVVLYRYRVHVKI